MYLYAVWAQGCFPKWAVYLRPAPILIFHPLIHKINQTSLASPEEKTFQENTSGVHETYIFTQSEWEERTNELLTTNAIAPVQHLLVTVGHKMRDAVLVGSNPDHSFQHNSTLSSLKSHRIQTTSTRQKRFLPVKCCI